MILCEHSKLLFLDNFIIINAYEIHLDSFCSLYIEYCLAITSFHISNHFKSSHVCKFVSCALWKFKVIGQQMKQLRANFRVSKMWVSREICIYFLHSKTSLTLVLMNCASAGSHAITTVLPENMVPQNGRLQLIQIGAHFADIFLS